MLGLEVFVQPLKEFVLEPTRRRLVLLMVVLGFGVCGLVAFERYTATFAVLKKQQLY
jgi:hypothetical protein